MQLCFSIDALSPSARDAWRLLDNGSWRPCRYAEALQPGDARITDKHEAEIWVGRRMQKDREKILLAKEKAGRFDFLMRGIFTHVVLHRNSAAPVPDKHQMLSCINHLRAGTPWLVYLDAGAVFRALDTSKVSIMSNLDIAVRGEIASSEEYIGPIAAGKEKMMNELYRQFLAGWLDHLRSSNMNVFIPDLEKLKTDEDYLAEIRVWQPEPSDR